MCRGRVPRLSANPAPLRPSPAYWVASRKTSVPLSIEKSQIPPVNFCDFCVSVAKLPRLKPAIRMENNELIVFIQVRCPVCEYITQNNYEQDSASHRRLNSYNGF